MRAIEFTTRVMMNRNSPAATSAAMPWLLEAASPNFSAMVDDKGLLKRDLADDGLHPNPAGFKIMAPLAEAAISKALATNP